MPSTPAFFTIVLALGIALPGGVAWALGTPSGTAVNNTATLQYAQGGLSREINSNASSFRVDEIANVVVQKTDADRIVVASPDTRRVMTFTITNTGNGSQRFQVSVNAANPNSQFDPAAVRMIVDSNGNGSYEPGVDVPYTAGQNDPVIAPDRSVTMFVVSDIPPARPNNDVGLIVLTVQESVGTGAPGTVFAGRGASGSDLVIGASRGIGVAQNGYVVLQAQPVLTKTQVVVNQGGGSAPLPGSIVTYSLQLDLRGSGSAFNGVVADTVPANTSYVPGSLRLDGVALTDRADGDTGRWTGNGIEVSLGSLVAPVSHVVSFQVRLN